MSETWRPVIFSDDCDSEGRCPLCKIDYAECPCPGPTQEDEFEYGSIRGVLMARPKKEDDRIIQQIADIRENNNRLWMQVLKIAVNAAPAETKSVLQQINHNDKAVSGLVERLAK